MIKTRKRRSDTEEDSERLTTAPLGTQLLIAGKLSEPDIAKIVATQRQTRSRFGETAVELGLVSQADVQKALSTQYEYPYSSAVDLTLSPALVAASEPFSGASEAFRRLRTQLLLSWLTDKRQVIAVTSARSGEGASAIAANLAVVFSQLGERTLLIDANLRNPVQHSIFGLQPGMGLSSMLSGRCSFNDALKRIDPYETLALLCAGAVPPNPQELLTRVQFSYLIETAAPAYDVVIVDTPAILDFADAQIIGKRTGGCLVSTSRNKTTVTDMKAVKSLLEFSGIELIGAVIGD